MGHPASGGGGLISQNGKNPGPGEAQTRRQRVDPVSEAGNIRGHAAGRDVRHFGAEKLLIVAAALVARAQRDHDQRQLAAVPGERLRVIEACGCQPRAVGEHPAMRGEKLLDHALGVRLDGFAIAMLAQDPEPEARA